MFLVDIEYLVAMERVEEHTNNHAKYTITEFIAGRRHPLIKDLAS
jgi:hypothetical protein